MTAADAPVRVPVAASVALRPLLHGSSTPARVLAAFPRAVYLEVASPPGVLAIVTSDGVAHPNALELTRGSRDRPLAGVHRWQRAELGAGRVVLDGVGELAVVRWFDPVPRLRPVGRARLRAMAVELSRRLRTHAPDSAIELSTEAAAVAAASTRGDVAAVIARGRQLLGRGPGLTPAGDDVLAGVFAGVLLLDAATRASQADVTAAAHDHASGPAAVVSDAGRALVAVARDRTTAVSAALLQCAVQGQVSPQVADVLHALCGRGQLGSTFERLLAVGATSGADLAVGMHAAAAAVAHAPLTPSGRAPARAVAAPGTTVTGDVDRRR